VSHLIIHYLVSLLMQMIEWANNKKCGKGMYKLKSGETYKGEFKAGMKDGKGKLKYASGEVYDGLWCVIISMTLIVAIVT
jgi:hypothetical protein